MKNKNTKMSLGGLGLSIGETVVFKAFKENSMKNRLDNKRESLRWDVLKVNKKSIVLQAWPTGQQLKLKIG